MPNKHSDHKITLTEFALLTVIIVTGSILIILGTSKYGVGLTGDSISYIALANNILKDFSFNDISGEPFVLWPQGYSLILAAFSLPTSGDVYAVLLPVNMIFYVSTVTFLWFLVIPRLNSRLFGYIVLVTAALSPAVLRIFSFAFAEVPFIPLMLLFFLLVDKIDGRNGIAFVFAAGVDVILLSLLKYTGILLLPVLLWAIYSGLDGNKRRTALFTAGLLVPFPAIWVLISNFIRSGTLTGYRGASSSGLFEILFETGATLLYWVFPAIVALVVVIRVFKRGQLQDDTIYDWYRSEKFLLGFSVLYFVVITLMSLSQAVDDMNNRLMIPLYFSLLIPTAVYIDKTLELVIQNRWRIAIIVLLCLVPLAYARTNYRGITAQFNFGAGGISTDEFHNKFPKDIEKLKAVTAGKKIYTNNPAVFYYLTGLPNKTIPRKKYYNSEEVTTPASAIRDYFKKGESNCIVMLRGFDDPDLYNTGELGVQLKIQREAGGESWILYSVTNDKRNAP